MYEFCDPLINDNQQALADTLAQRFDWLWDYDLDADLDVARSRLGWES